MTTKDENQIENKNEDTNDFESLENEINELKNKEQEEIEWDFTKAVSELNLLKDSLARAQADYQNLLRRVERDKLDMWIYITSNVVLKILPFVDNLERLISATPEDLQCGSLFEWIKSTYSGIIKTLESMWIKSYDSIWQEVDINLHEVMSQLPWKQWVIIQEFEKWYKLQDKIIRHAKVIVGNWEE